ncbi:helicostatins-like, partial [Daktulosphaira vitifoliae]
MQNCGMWFVLVAVMTFTTLVAGGDDKSKVQNQHQQQQQQADVMRAIADIGSPSMSQPSVDSYLESDPLQVPYEYNTAKRAHKQYGFGLGKRLYRQYQFGLGKRASSKQYGFGLGKRAALKQYG